MKNRSRLLAARPAVPAVVPGSDRKRPQIHSTGIGPADRRYRQEQENSEQEGAEGQSYIFSPK